MKKIKPLVPPNYLIDMISRMKKEELEKLKRNYLVACAKTMSDSSEFMETEIGTALLYDKPEVCVLSKMLPNDDFLIILNYTVRIGEWGKQDYTFIHEFIHAIDCFSADDCGFDDNREEIGKSPYQNKRKYERLNETLTDMLAMEVRNNLHRKGIYFAEDKEFIIYDVEDDNTNHLLKEILKPLVDKYKKQIIEAKLTGRKEVLFDLIGLDNFENLNDALDMVDSLIKKEFEKSEVLMEEYSKQMERISAIYENMGITFNLMKI